MYMAMRDEEVNMLELSTFMHGELKADVFKKDNSYGCRFYDAEGDKICEELYPGHSEQWAENAAENYVFGIKIIGV
tara:strand:- start:410 stop:637 length:228 start_codon:yes stop_codon:yes gene_type:complete